MKEETCINCKRFIKIYCKNRCSTCYYNGMKKQRICKECGLLKTHASAKMCESCYYQSRKDIKSSAQKIRYRIRREKIKEQNKPNEIQKAKEFLESHGYVVSKEEK